MQITRQNVTSSLYSGRASGILTRAAGIVAATQGFFAKLRRGEGLPNLQIFSGGSRLGGIFSGVKNWLRRAWSGLSSLSSLLRGIVAARQFLWTFNWNTTDAQISQRQQAIVNNLAGIAGEATGTLLGTYFCGGLVAKKLQNNAPRSLRTNVLDLIPKMRELSRLSWSDPGEMYENAVDEIKQAGNAAVRAARQLIGWEAFRNVRKLIRAANSGLGFNSQLIDRWGQEGSDPWSFSEAVEEWIESFDGPMENFLEEFVDSFLDACDESLLLVASQV